MAGDGFFGTTLQTPVALLGAMALAIVVLGVILWSLKRHVDPTLNLDTDAAFDALVPSLAGLTHGSLVAGNRVELFENGAFFEMMFDEIAQATRSVHFETFLWKDGVLGRRLVDALVERRRAGVKVRVLVDANGGREMGDESRRRLAEAGCEPVVYHAKRRPRNLGRINRRDHRKLVVLDGRVALAGGHCIVDSWLGDAEDRDHVRDLGVRVRGPAVRDLQSTFCENWIDETGELFVGDDVFPPLTEAGDVALHVARVKPEGSPPAVKVLHHLVLCVARERLWIQNPYFLPDTAAVAALAAAVRRGVDVRVMVPSASASDMALVQHAAHHRFQDLLDAGVRILEYQRTLLHQKVMTVDGVWCAIGSSNFDDRSFEINDEITLGLCDAALARRLEQIFERDARDCIELQAATWKRRGLPHRLMDRGLHLFKEQL